MKNKDKKKVLRLRKAAEAVSDRVHTSQPLDPAWYPLTARLMKELREALAAFEKT